MTAVCSGSSSSSRPAVLVASRPFCAAPTSPARVFALPPESRVLTLSSFSPHSLIIHPSSLVRSNAPFLLPIAVSAKQPQETSSQGVGKAGG